MMKLAFCLGVALTAVLALPAAAQDANSTDASSSTTDRGKLSGDYLAVGVGAGYGPSYEGSDDYVLFPVPLVQGRFHGVDINPRGGGLALDFIPNPPDRIGFNLGVAAKVRLTRTHDTHDAVVNKLGKLNTAIEVGPTVGFTVPHVLDAYDSLTFTTDVLWDVGGAYKGMVVDPMVSYSTPLSRGILANLSLNAEYGDRKFANYYYSITPAQSAASGLPVFHAGSGFNKVGARLLLGVDLDGDLTDGGAAIFVLGGYTRQIGDGKRTPLTSLRGSPDQFLGAVGVGYTF